MKSKRKISIVLSVILCGFLIAACAHPANRDERYTVISETFTIEPGKHDFHSTYPLIYDKNDISITYPQITGLKDTKKQRELNALIETEAKKMLVNNELYEVENLYLHLDYEIKLASDNILSIFYVGDYGATINPGRPTRREVIGTTIDIKAAKVVQLPDIITDCNTLFDLLNADEFESITEWDGYKGVYLFSNIAGNFYRDYLGSREFDIGNHYIEWYTEEANFVIVVLHGNSYDEFSIAHSKLKDLYSDEWKKVFRYAVDGNNDEPIRNNLFDEMFYGEWEMTDWIFVDRMPTRGTYYNDDELNAAMEFYRNNCVEKKLTFCRENIIINDENTIQGIKYEKRLFPSNDDYLIHFTMTLKDIGLTEAAGKYYIIVEVETDARFESRRFFIKDQNTLIVYHGDHCIEYTRTSFEGGTETPVVIIG